MFKKGDVINAIPPKEYGEWSCLMFTEDAKPRMSSGASAR